MNSLGQRLRSERLKQGLELAEIATRTRIKMQYLEATEAGKPESIPGEFFYRAFVRQYAQAVGLNPADVEPEPGSVDPAGTRPRLNPPTRLNESPTWDPENPAVKQ